MNVYEVRKTRRRKVTHPAAKRQTHTWAGKTDEGTYTYIPKVPLAGTMIREPWLR